MTFSLLQTPLFTPFHLWGENMESGFFSRCVIKVKLGLRGKVSMRELLFGVLVLWCQLWGLSLMWISRVFSLSFYSEYFFVSLFCITKRIGKQIDKQCRRTETACLSIGGRTFGSCMLVDISWLDYCQRKKYCLGVDVSKSEGGGLRSRTPHHFNDWVVKH